MQIRSCTLSALLLLGGTHHLAADALYSVTDLGTAGVYSAGFGINNLGQVTGSVEETGGAVHAFLYSNGQMRDLGTLGGALSIGNSINDLGQVTGTAQTTAGDGHAFLYSNGKMRDIGTLGGASSSGYGINGLMQITGSSETKGGNDHAFLYSNGKMRDIGTLGGAVSIGQSINNLGQIAGSASTMDALSHAFLYSNGQMRDLGTFGGNFSVANSINDLGQVVGSAETVAGDDQAFLYSEGTMLDINNLIDPKLGIILSSAEGINDEGQIVANDGEQVYLLTPVPEPEPGMLGLLGGALLAGAYTAGMGLRKTVSLALTASDFRRIALNLEGVEEYSHAGFPAFRVGGRKFASLASQPAL
jgi:probable HAF family extracellular repeat protein